MVLTSVAKPSLTSLSSKAAATKSVNSGWCRPYQLSQENSEGFRTQNTRDKTKKHQVILSANKVASLTEHKIPRARDSKHSKLYRLNTTNTCLTACPGLLRTWIALQDVTVMTSSESVARSLRICFDLDGQALETSSKAPFTCTRVSPGLEDWLQRRKAPALVLFLTQAEIPTPSCKHISQRTCRQP